MFSEAELKEMAHKERLGAVRSKIWDIKKRLGEMAVELDELASYLENQLAVPDKKSAGSLVSLAMMVRREAELMEFTPDDDTDSQ